MTAENVALGVGGHRLSDGGFLVRCPVPAHGRGLGDRRPSLSIKDGTAGVIVHCFAGCDALAVLNELRRRGLIDDRGRARAALATRVGDKGSLTRNSEKARFLWHQRLPIHGTPAEHYLRQRGYAGLIPPTLCFLPPWGKHPPAMISAFTMPAEPEPGLLVVNDAPVGIHITKLTIDGRKANTTPSKVMLGKSLGTPLVLSAMNDSLGLVVVEGIETGLSILAATGCGVWVAGSAVRMPALAVAVPSFTSFVTVLGEDDGGLRYAQELAERLRAQGIFAEMRVLGRSADSSKTVGWGRAA